MNTAEFQSKYPTWSKIKSPEEKQIERLATHSYWNGNGRYQQVYDKLSEQIPEIGESDKVHIEALRCITNIYYDVYNNGGCNLYDRDTHDGNDGGEYYEYYTYKVDSYYADMVVKVTCFNDGEQFLWWRNADNTDLGELIINIGKQGGQISDRTLAKIETMVDNVIRRAYGIDRVAN